jgi:signal transduction histidine kinase
MASVIALDPPFLEVVRALGRDILAALGLAPDGGPTMRHAGAPWFEALAALLMGGVLTVSFPRLRSLICLFVTVGLTLLLLAATAAAYAGGLPLDPLSPIIAAHVVLVVGSTARLHALERRHREIAEALAVRTDEAERAERARSAFLVEMTHDFRTPINAIHGAAWAISQRARGGDLAGVLEHVHAIEALSGQMRTLVRRAVFAAELDAPDPPLHEERVELGALLREAAGLARLAAPELHEDADIRIEQADVAIWADRVYMREAAISLISNAVAYGAANGPVTCCDGVTEAGEPFLEVHDHGGGLSDDFLEANAAPLHERAFQKVSSGAYGLGLFAARAVAERHGGKLVLKHATPGVLAARIVLPPERRMAD